jgi:uncharacterized membrane protein YgcG
MVMNGSLTDLSPPPAAPTPAAPSTSTSSVAAAVKAFAKESTSAPSVSSALSYFKRRTSTTTPVNGIPPPPPVTAAVVESKSAVEEPSTKTLPAMAAVVSKRWNATKTMASWKSAARMGAKSGPVCGAPAARTRAGSSSSDGGSGSDGGGGGSDDDATPVKTSDARDWEDFVAKDGTVQYRNKRTGEVRCVVVPSHTPSCRLPS